MAITSYSSTRSGNVVTVTVTSDLAGTVYYHWYRDGVYVGMTNLPVKAFFVPFNEQARVTVIDTNDAAYDAIANAPTSFAANRTLYWTRSLTDDVLFYRIYRQIINPFGELEPVLVARIPAISNQWDYRYLTPQISETEGGPSSLYYRIPRTVQFSIVPEDVAGNLGTPVVVTERLIRRPDAPAFEIAFDEGTTRVAISEPA